MCWLSQRYHRAIVPCAAILSHLLINHQRDPTVCRRRRPAQVAVWPISPCADNHASVTLTRRPSLMLDARLTAWQRPRHRLAPIAEATRRIMHTLPRMFALCPKECIAKEEVHRIGFFEAVAGIRRNDCMASCVAVTTRALAVACVTPQRPAGQEDGAGREWDLHERHQEVP